MLFVLAGNKYPPWNYESNAKKKDKLIRVREKDRGNYIILE